MNLIPGDLKIESHTALHSAVASLSTGPVAPSDAIDKFNKSLIMRACNADGLLLKPSRPAFVIDPQLWQVRAQLAHRHCVILLGDWRKVTVQITYEVTFCVESVFFFPKRCLSWHVKSREERLSSRFRSSFKNVPMFRFWFCNYACHPRLRWRCRTAQVQTVTFTRRTRTFPACASELRSQPLSPPTPRTV